MGAESLTGGSRVASIPKIDSQNWQASLVDRHNDRMYVTMSNMPMRG